MTTQAKKPAYARSCPECGERFTTTDPRRLFCSKEHKLANGNLDVGRGKTLVKLAQAWRGGRSTKDPAKRRAAKVAFREMCKLLDAYNAEDVKANRKSGLDVIVSRHRRDGVHQVDLPGRATSSVPPERAAQSPAR